MKVIFIEYELQLSESKLFFGLNDTNWPFQSSYGAYLFNLTVTCLLTQERCNELCCNSAPLGFCLFHPIWANQSVAGRQSNICATGSLSKCAGLSTLLRSHKQNHTYAGFQEIRMERTRFFNISWPCETSATPLINRDFFFNISICKFFKKALQIL